MLRWGWGAFGLVLVGGLVAADPPAEATVTDGSNREVRVAALQFGAGTRRLAWLADPAGATEDAKKGPLVLELREPHSTNYAQGIVTYVPLGSVESIRYDYDRLVAAVAVKGVPEPLAGTLQYKGVNVFAFDGTADGKPVTFSGGTLAPSRIRAVTFAGARPAPARKEAAAWQVQIDQPKALNPTLKATNFKFLYQRADGTEVLADAATVRKGDPFALDASVTLFTVLAVDPNTRLAVVEVQTGAVEKLLVIPQEVERDGKKAVLVGLVGEVEAGWKLFPLRAIKGGKPSKRE